MAREVMPAASRAALRDDIVKTLREQIIDGTLPPSFRLNERDLSAEFNVSRVPVREAIIQLSAEGLVDVRPRVGAFVTPLTRDKVREVFEVRGSLEPLAASLCAHRAKRVDLDAMHALIVRARKAEQDGDQAAGASANAEFHELMYAASGNKLLDSMVPALNSLTRRLFRHNINAHEEMMWTDHAEIYSAISKGDSEHAGELAAAHLDHTRRHTFKMFDQDDAF